VGFVCGSTGEGREKVWSLYGGYFGVLPESCRIPLGGHEKFYGGLVGVVRESCRRPIVGDCDHCKSMFVSLLSVLLEGIVWLSYIGCCIGVVLASY
jgi:hypothetical protein